VYVLHAAHQWGQIRSAKRLTVLGSQPCALPACKIVRMWQFKQEQAVFGSVGESSNAGLFSSG
jgi:hypothetical protein